MLLIISESKHQAEDLSDMFNFMGVLSIAASPEESAFEISEIFRAIIVLSPKKIKECDALYQLLISYGNHVPIFTIGARKEKFEQEFILEEELSASEIFESIKLCCYDNGFSVPGDYRLPAEISRRYFPRQGSCHPWRNHTEKTDSDRRTVSVR